MAENKKSFILYCDLIHTVKKMPIKKAGELFITILEYVNDLNPKVNDLAVDLVFEPIKHQLKRDLKEWEETRADRSKAGKLGGIRSGETRRNKANEASASKSKQTQANEAVTVNATVTDNDISEIEIGATIQFCVLSLNRDYNKKRIVELWQAFLINGQEKSYTGRGKKIQHFRNWIKTQPNLNGTHQQPNRPGVKAGSKSSGAHKLVDQMRTEYEQRSGQ